MTSVDDPSNEAAARKAVEAVWRIESGRLIAALARITRDLGAAEELAQDALVTALEQWPRTGVPPNPGGWLMTTAKNRAVDEARRRQTYRRKLETVGRDAEIQQEYGAPDLDDAVDDHIGDDLLRLIFTACHPVLPMESRVALTLRCVGGLSTDEIARAFLVSEATAAQRIVRAKRTLADHAVAFELPTRAEADARLSAVLEVVYLIFNEGYSATAGEDWMRPALCEDALRLARIIAELMPDRPEVHGFVALLELQASRIPARTAADGTPVLLLDQDRRRWDRLLIRRGLDALARAEELASAPDAPVPPPAAPGLREGAAARPAAGLTTAGLTTAGSPAAGSAAVESDTESAPSRAIGPYTLQAAIAACHARALRAEDTDWERIAALYEVLGHLWPTPVVELNRAVAVGMARGPADGLAVVDAIVAADALRGYPQVPAVRADLLGRLGRVDEARAEFERAAGLTRNEQERAIFLRRAAALAGS